jgi:hypothetical protein
LYSEAVVQRRLRAIEQHYKVKLHRYAIEESVAISKHVSLAFDEKGHQIRALKKQEQDFIWNEMALCRADFKYWAERYCTVVPKGGDGKRVHMTLTSAQNIFVKRMARTEDKMWAERDAGHTTFDGQCYFVHKARQMGLSTHCELVGVHIGNFYSDTPELIGSTNDQMTQKMYTDYYLSVYDNMPYWMKSPLRSKVKDRGLDYSHNSRVVLQDASQKSGFGQGSNWVWCHLTEVASWPDPVGMVENHFFPSISLSHRTAAFLESTSQGMDDWWHTRTEAARRGDFGRWQYLFIPWYLVPEFYHGYPPDEWVVPDHAAREAKLIADSSPEWADGVTIRPTKAMLYWWVQMRKTYEDTNTLNEFYKNYPSVPEQSFTHSGQSSFEHEVIEILEQMSHTPPVPYEIATKKLPSELIITDAGPSGPKIYPIGKHDLVPVHVPESMQKEARGLILMYEQPSERHDYFGGADTAGGIANWSRYMRHKGDTDKDNAAIQIIRRGFYGKPDVQVCEFAAPIMPQDFAPYIALLGELYKGREECNQCLFTIEVNGYGKVTQTELMEKYEYINLYQRVNTKDGVNIDVLNQFGWLTTIQSITELWTMGKKWISSGMLETRSKYLVREMRYCRDDDVRLKIARSMIRGKAAGVDKETKSQRHDDRVYATLFALEGAHGFSQHLEALPPNLDMVPVIVSASPRNIPATERDLTYAEYVDAINDHWAEFDF